MATKTTKKTTTKKDNSAEIMASVINALDFVKSNISNDLMTAKSRGLIELENDDMRKIADIVKNSITSSFFKASDQIETSIKASSK